MTDRAKRPANGPEYNAARSKSESLKHKVRLKAVELGVRMGGIIVLDSIIAKSEFWCMESTFTKNQLMEHNGLKRKATQNALALLRDLGLIVCVDGVEGGRGVPTTYRIVLVGQGAEKAIEAPKEGRDSREYAQRLTELLKRETYGEARRICDQEFDID